MVLVLERGSFNVFVPPQSIQVHLDADIIMLIINGLLDSDTKPNYLGYFCRQGSITISLYKFKLSL